MANVYLRRRRLCTFSCPPRNNNNEQCGNTRLQHDSQTVMRKRAQRKRPATDKAAQQKGQRKPTATKAAQQKAKRLRFGSVGVRSNLGHPPPLSESAARRLYTRDTEVESSEDDEV